MPIVDGDHPHHRDTDVAHHLAIQLDAWKHSIADPVRIEVDHVEVYKFCW
ncbi:MAG: hypothetical protein WBM50_28115 [Acidimicrobiales bacterium]